MKAKILITIGFTIFIFLLVKLFLPISFMPVELDMDAKAHIIKIQKDGQLDPELLSKEYLHYQVENVADIPEYSKINVYRIGNHRIVTLHNNKTQDDSVFRRLDIIKFRQDENGVLIPIKHKWTQQTRGRLGWTNQPGV